MRCHWPAGSGSCVAVFVFALSIMDCHADESAVTEPSGLDALAATRQRPLFSPTRRPPPPPVEAQSAEPMAAPAPSIPPPSLEIRGIIVGTDISVAIVRRSQDAKEIHLSVGSQIEGWTVSDIGPRAIILRLEDRSVTISLPDPSQHGHPMSGAAKSSDPL